MLLRFLRRRRRQQWQCAPFPESWRPIVERQAPFFPCLTAADQDKLLSLMQVFCREKRFEGCGGLEMSDEIRLTIAAHACLLLLHLPEHDYYPRLRSIIVYPDTYVAPSWEPGPAGIMAEHEDEMSGESWDTGSIVLSWAAIEEDCEYAGEGQNVIFHEFAHQLDQEDGEIDGAPRLGRDLSLAERRQRYASWAQVMQNEYKRLQRQAGEGRETLLDPYGATEPAEFFAVTTEAFFDCGDALKREHPELYDELSRYFGQDPAAWMLPPGG